MHRGYIKFWRKIEDTSLINDIKAMYILFRLTMSANWKDKKTVFNGKEIIIPRGSLIFGRKSFAERYGIKETTLYKKIKLLENLKIIGVKCNNKFSVISIINYALYQDTEVVKEQQRNSKGTTKEQQNNTSKEREEVKERKESNICEDDKVENLAKKVDEVVSYLNKVKGSKYNAKSKENIKMISARLKEGYTVDDCKKVVDVKYNQWKDSDEFKIYIRPKTLFSNKFDDYLNQEPLKQREPEYPDHVELEGKTYTVEDCYKDKSGAWHLQPWAEPIKEKEITC